MIHLGFQAGFSLYLQIWMCLDCSCSAYLKLMVTCAVLLWEMRSDCLSSSQSFKRLAPWYSWCISFSASLWKKNQQTCSMLLFQNSTYFFHLLNIFNRSFQFTRLEHDKTPMQAAGSHLCSCLVLTELRNEGRIYSLLLKWSIQLKLTSILKNNNGVHLGCSTPKLPLSQWDSSHPWRMGIVFEGVLFDKPRGALGWVAQGSEFLSKDSGNFTSAEQFFFQKIFLFCTS